MKCSVLMSVYDRERPSYLRDSLRSLELQSYQADEVVLVQDGEITDELRAVIESFASVLPIKSVKLSAHVGLGAALNAGLGHCSHALVARMDADDVALPQRLEKQVRFMAENGDVSVSSAWIAEKNAAMSATVLVKRLPTTHSELAPFAKRRSPINHPACIFRKDSVLSVGGYPKVFPEDYALWSLMLVRGFRFANIPEVLLDMRTGDDFIHRRGFSFLRREIGLVRFQVSIGFFNPAEAALFFAVRAAVRLPPARIRKLLYEHAR